MKKILLSFAIVSLLFSCKEEKNTELSTDLSQLLKEKSLLEHRIDSLESRLKTVDIAINKRDTTKKHKKITVCIAKDTLFNSYLKLQGTVSSNQNLVLTPEMGGTITRVLVKEGQRVSAGQSLVQFDNQTLINQINELKTQLNLATTTFERQERLWSQKIGSEMQYLQVKSQKEALENSIKTLNSQLAKLTLRAPYSGVIDEIIAKKGQMTSPASPILRLINLKKMYVETEVPEAYLKNVKKHTSVVLDFPAINKQVESKISEIGNFINPENRSFKVKINLNNADRSLKPNLLADLKINDFSAKGIVLPKDIIQIDQKGQSFVYKVNQEQDKTYVEKVFLTLGEEYDNKVLITEGLKEGETLVKEGGKFVKDKEQVIIE